MTAVVAPSARGHAGVEVRDAGLAHLKNVSAPVSVFELVAQHEHLPSAVDPICRMRVDEAEAVARIAHRGRA